jgi:hypothetical protein
VQLLESGQLTDSTGRVADFTNTIIILTNRPAAGSPPIGADLGGPEGAREENVGTVESTPLAAPAGAIMSGAGQIAAERRRCWIESTTLCPPLLSNMSTFARLCESRRVRDEQRAGALRGCTCNWVPGKDLL